MKNKAFLILLVLLNFGFNTFELSKGLKKKVAKEIKAVYEIENFILDAVLISEDINKELNTHIGVNNLFKILRNSELIGYAFIDSAASKTDSFEYLVLFDTDLIITKSKVLVYREDYGAEIGSKRWLKQFIGLNSSSEIKYSKEIKAISGATISARSMTIAINNLLKSIHILRLEKII